MNLMLPARIAGLVLIFAPLSSCAWLFGWKSEVVVPEPDPVPAPKPPEPPQRPEPKPEPPAPPKEAVPVARAVPGRPGFVFSPFNNKLINVEGFESGRLVADPHYPASEKKYFRVP
jgi:hypothetical protein